MLAKARVVIEALLGWTQCSKSVVSDCRNWLRSTGSVSVIVWQVNSKKDSVHRLRAERAAGLFERRAASEVGSEPCDIVKDVENFRGSEFGISTANLRRAHGGCLGVKRKKGVEVCEKPGGVDKQVMIPGFPTAAG